MNDFHFKEYTTNVSEKEMKKYRIENERWKSSCENCATAQYIKKQMLQIKRDKIRIEDSKTTEEEDTLGNPETLISSFYVETQPMYQDESYQTALFVHKPVHIR